MNTININLMNGYRIESLCIDDCNIVEELCEKCSDYYLLVEGVLPSKKDAAEIFMDLPPNKDYEDKYVLGIFRYDNKLVGIVDIVKDFPDNSEWMIGLMLIEIDERGNGLGRIVHEELKKWAADLGAKSFRIGVVTENYKGMKFWSNLGYKKIKEVDMNFTAKKHIVNVMRLRFDE